MTQQFAERATDVAPTGAATPGFPIWSASWRTSSGTSWT